MHDVNVRISSHNRELFIVINPNKFLNIDLILRVKVQALASPA